MFKFYQDWYTYKKETRKIIMTNPQLVKAELIETEKTDYYKRNTKYKIMTDLHHVMCDNLLADYDSAVQRGGNLLKELAKFDYPNLLAETYHVLGIAFAAMGIANEVMHCYSNIISIEEENGRTNLTSVAYINIGTMYHDLADYQNALKMYRKAYESLLESRYGAIIDASIRANCAANLLSLCSYLGNSEEATKYYNIIQEIDLAESETRTHHLISSAKMVYFGSIGEYRESRRYCEQLIEMIFDKNDRVTLLTDIMNYIEICRKAGLDYASHIDVVTQFEDDEMDEVPANKLVKYYGILADYYEVIGDHKKAYHHYKNVRRFSDAALTFSDDLQLRSVQVRQELERVREKGESARLKNKELSEITKEALLMRNKLQEAYNKIKTISMLGSGLTTATEFSELAGMIYEIISDKMHITGFVLMSRYSDEDSLESVSVYGVSEEESKIRIALDDPESQYVKSYCENRTIVVDEVTDTIRKNDAIPMFEHIIESIVFIPLSYKNEVIGVFSVQTIHKSAYDGEKIDFLKSISPYLSIALNNVNKARVLREEIDSHRKTQHQLEEVNLYLKNLSSIDGLTQVSNRRTFGEAYFNLLNRAIEQDISISVIMIDIDYFKKFNDRYGHIRGDEALIKVAQKINEAFKDDKSVFARFGGEEFIAVRIGFTLKELKDTCEQIRLSIANFLIPNEDTDSGYLTVSVGAAFCQPVCLKLKAPLMKRADELLYVAKGNGRNRSEVDTL